MQRVSRGALHPLVGRGSLPETPDFESGLRAIHHRHHIFITGCDSSGLTASLLVGFPILLHTWRSISVAGRVYTEQGRDDAHSASCDCVRSSHHQRHALHDHYQQGCDFIAILHQPIFNSTRRGAVLSFVASRAPLRRSHSGLFRLGRPLTQAVWGPSHAPLRRGARPATTTHKLDVPSRRQGSSRVALSLISPESACRDPHETASQTGSPRAQCGRLEPRGSQSDSSSPRPRRRQRGRGWGLFETLLPSTL